MTVDLASPSVGLDRRTGAIVTGFDDVLQSIEDIFTTSFGERVMREWYGSLAPALLGRNLNAATVLVYFATVSAALEQFEPRVRVAKIDALEVTREGELRFEMQLIYRPRALLGDFTVEGARRVGTLFDESGAARVEQR